MSLFSWFSANEDGEVVAKTDVKGNGEVHRYTYTKEDDISKGHGHAIYESMEDFVADEDPEWERDKDSPKSINRRRHGEGYNMILEELKLLKECIISSELHTSNELILKLK